ncbi:MAG: hypothetical protein WDW38_001742 [Sanguina aurantia]
MALSTVNTASDGANAKLEPSTAKQRASSKHSRTNADDDADPEESVDVYEEEEEESGVSEAEDDDDEDFGGGSSKARKPAVKRGRAVATAAAAAAAGKRRKAAASRGSESEEQEDDGSDDDDDDDDDEGDALADSEEASDGGGRGGDGSSSDDEDFGAKRAKKRAKGAGGGGGGGGRSSASLSSRRPTRQAAQAANQRMQGHSHESDNDGGDGDGGDGGMGGGEGGEDDAELAWRLSQQINGLRTRPGRRDTVASPAGRPASGGRPSRPRAGASPPSRRSRRAAEPQRNSSRRAGARVVSYAEDDEDDEDGGLDRGLKGKEPIAAFDDPGSTPEEVEKVVAHRDMASVPEEDRDRRDMWATREMFVKWKLHSHIHCSWEPKRSLEKLAGYKRVLNYMRRSDDLVASRPHVSREEQELRDVEIEMEAQLNTQHMQVGWTDPQPQTQGVGTRELKEQPDYLGSPKLRLRDYQLESLNWMAYSWSEDRNIILADEMGLGKTVQCVSFVGLLTEVQLVRGPFLVVVPLSVVPNWIREFKRWVPYVNTVVYVGDSRSREVIRAYEFDVERCGTSRAMRFEVLITTYELILKDAPILGAIKWNYLMVDEAHRLKNADSALYQELMSWNFKNKLLITGTPLQNNMKELWALLHFLQPAKFDDLEAFERDFQVDNATRVTNLHAVLRPYLLRRVIKEVEKSLPPKNERILRVQMSPLQRQYYKWILSKNFKELNKGTRGGQISLLNVITELKKCCNHPFLFESAEEEYRGNEADRSAADRLVATSGKMVLLDKLLVKLKATNHRVLIFSQMVRVLDIISDYMRLRGYQHQRLDGSTPAAARHQAMEHFNRPESPDFAFLLSTRAGGLGINLATADTVIIYDSDWNPQSDLQAMSRAHRIGQTSTVNIYRFVTSCSVEEDILERAKRKMVLDHLVIQRMDTSGRTILDQGSAGGVASAKALFGKEELAAILRFGAEELFKRDEQENAAQEKAMLEEDIDAILDRAEVVDTAAIAESSRPGGGAEGGAGGGPGDLLNSFNVASFRGVEDDTAFWNKLIPVLERPPEEEILLPRAARMHSANDHPGGSQPHNAGSDDEADHRKGSGRGHSRREPQQRVQRSRPAGVGEPGPRVDGAALRVDEWCVEVDDEGAPLAKQDDGGEAAAHDEGGAGAGTRTLSRRDAAAFVRGVRRYALVTRIADVCTEAGRAVEELSRGARIALWQAFIGGCKAAVDATQGEDAKVRGFEEGHDGRVSTCVRCVTASESPDSGKAEDAILDFFGVAVKAQELLTHVSQFRMLARRISGLKDPPSLFKLDAGSQLPPPKWGKLLGWTAREDAMLLLGVHDHGLGTLGGDHVTDRHTPSRCAATHLETRVMGLLRKLANSVKVSSKKPAPGPKLPRQHSQQEKQPRLQAASAARVLAAKSTHPHPASALSPTATATARSAAAGLGSPGAVPHAGGSSFGSGHHVPDPGGSSGGGGGSQKAASAGKSKRVSHDGGDGGGGHHPAAAPARERLDKSGSSGAGVGGRATSSGRTGQALAGSNGDGAADHAPEASARRTARAILEPVADQLKAMRRLQEQEGMERKLVVEKTKTCLLAIGGAVDRAGRARGDKVCGPLWETVAKVLNRGSDRSVSGSSLESMYARLRPGAQASAAAAAAAAQGAGTAPAPHSGATAGGSSGGTGLGGSGSGRPAQGASSSRPPGGSSHHDNHQQQQQHRQEDGRVFDGTQQREGQQQQQLQAGAKPRQGLGHG